MWVQRAQVELSELAKHAFRLSVVLALVAVVVLLRAGARLDDELHLARQEQESRQAVVRQVNESILTRQREAERVAELVREELARREQIHLAMAEILARARALQDEQDRLASLEQRVREALARAETHYARMRSTARGQ